MPVETNSFFICFLFCLLSITHLKREVAVSSLTCAAGVSCVSLIEHSGLPMGTSKQCSRLVPSRLLVGRGSAQGNVRREEAALEGFWEVFVWTHNPVRSPSFYYQATGYESGSTVSVGQSKKRGGKRIASANCMK